MDALIGSDAPPRSRTSGRRSARPQGAVRVGRLRCVRRGPARHVRATPATGAPRRPASPAAAGPPAASSPCPGRRAQPAHRAEAAAVGRRGRDVGAGAEAAQVEGGRVVPAHAVEQLGQFGGGAGGDEELGAALGGGGDRAEGQAHALQPGQGAAPGGLGDLDHVEGAARRAASPRRRGTPPRPRSLRRAWRRPGPRGAKSSGWAPGAAAVGARRTSRRPPPARAPGTTSQPHSPVNSATAVHSEERPRRRRGRTDLPDAADREAHAPSNGSGAPVVTRRTRNVTLRCRSALPPVGGAGGVRGGALGGARP